MKCNVSIMRNAGVVPAALFVFAMILVQSLAAQNGAVYYVSTTGSDSNPGTLAAPWLTIQHAANTVTAGATVNVLGGSLQRVCELSKLWNGIGADYVPELSHCGWDYRTARRDRRDRLDRKWHPGPHHYLGSPELHHR